MKKSSLLVAGGVVSVTLGFSAFPTLAQQRSTEQGPRFLDYLGAGLAISDVDKFDNGLALVVNGGKEFESLPGVAVEGELTSTITSPETETNELTYWTLGGYGVYGFPVSKEFGVRGRLGAVYENVSVDGPGDDKDEINMSLGLGAVYHMTPRTNLVADYTRIEEDINHLSAGVQFRF